MQQYTNNSRLRNNKKQQQQQRLGDGSNYYYYMKRRRTITKCYSSVCCYIMIAICVLVASIILLLCFAVSYMSNNNNSFDLVVHDNNNNQQQNSHMNDNLTSTEIIEKEIEELFKKLSIQSTTNTSNHGTINLRTVESSERNNIHSSNKHITTTTTKNKNINKKLECQRMHSINDLVQCYNDDMIIKPTNCSLNDNSIQTFNDLHSCSLIGPHRINDWGELYYKLYGIQNSNQQQQQQQADDDTSSTTTTTTDTDTDTDSNSVVLPPKLIKHIQIIGERNSGTKFIRKEIFNCFSSTVAEEHNYDLINDNDNNLYDNNNTKQKTILNIINTNTIKVSRDFIRGKHFFQPIDTNDYRDRLLVIVVRDPIEWMLAMIQSPYHSPYHIKDYNTTTTGTTTTSSTIIPLHWKEFISRPWTMPYTYNGQLVQSEYDNNILHNLTEDEHSNERSTLASNTNLCTEHYKFTQVSPCRYDYTVNPLHIPNDIIRGYTPIYELKQHRLVNEHPYYDTILQLRAEKLFNWIIQLPLLMLLGGVLVIRYDDLLTNGTESMLQQIATVLHNNQQEVINFYNNNINDNDNNDDDANKQDEETNIQLPSYCKATPPQPDRIGQRPISDEFRQWIKDNINHDMERLLGYDV